MEQIGQQAAKALDHLYVILEAGERGYAVADANVDNRALKMLFKTHARQRADFKGELAELFQIAEVDFHSPSGILATGCQAALGPAIRGSQGGGGSSAADARREGQTGGSAFI